jgi:hypothetical protein
MDRDSFDLPESLVEKARRLPPANLATLHEFCVAEATRRIGESRVSIRQTVASARAGWAQIALSSAVSVKHAAATFGVSAGLISQHRSTSRFRAEAEAFGKTLRPGWHRVDPVNPDGAISTLEACPCGAHAVIAEHPESVEHNRWSVRCSRKSEPVRGRQGRPKTACDASVTVYSASREFAIGRWNNQFSEVEELDDGAERCRCGLRMPCNNCIGPVEQYARSGEGSGGGLRL